MGLVQGAIEAAGITTVSITLRPEVTWAVRAPRAAYVRFPTGNPLGEAGRPDHQRAILLATLNVAVQEGHFGQIEELPFRWRRMD